MMKKINTIFYIVGTVCFLIAIYIITDKYFIKDNSININFNEDEEIELLNDKLTETGSSLGWILIVDGINNQDSNGNYNITFNKDLFDTYSYRQLFVMEYILSNSNNYELFTVLDTSGNVIEDSPTSDMTQAYIDYDEYNKYYKSIFGEDFNTDKAIKGNTIYSNNNVYYENRRIGSSGVYVSMIQASEVKYSDNVYTSNITITYSTRASSLVGSPADKAILKYTKDINGNIIFKSFVIEGR